jgi:uncharacterized protein
MTRFRILIVFLMALLAWPAMAEPSFPKLTGRVVDQADLLSPPQEAALVARLATLEQQTGHQLVVATLPDLQGYDIGDYGYQLGRAWGLGAKETNDGALLIVAPKERKVRIEVGYGLEPLLTDAFSSRTVQDTILPRFKANDYPGGIAAGVEAIAGRIAISPEEAAKREQAAAQTQAQKPRGRSVNGGAFIFWIVVFLFVILPMLMRAGRGRRYSRSGLGEAILWTAINAAANSGRSSGGSSWSGGGGGSDWGGGGGGGFSGGGGSFGGGGASGGW